MPALSSYVALTPWDSVLKIAATDPVFWARELQEPALHYSLGHGRSEPSFVEKQPPQQGAEGLSKRAAKRKREDARRAADATPPPQVQQRPQHPSKGSKGDGKGHPRKGKRGGYTTTRDGSQICFTWNAAQDGCKSPCPNNRAHVCTKCLQSHRACGCNQGGGGKPHM